MLDDLGELPASGDLVVTALPGGTPVASAWRLPRLPARLSVGRAGRRGPAAIVLACALILLSQFTAGTATSHAALPPPLALPPSVAANAPIVLPAAAWRAIPLPFDNGHLRSFAAAPDDPTTLYACSGAGVDPLGAVRIGALTVWRSRDAGAHWAMLPIPAEAGTDCHIQLAPANPARLALLLGDYTTETRACGRSRLLLSEDAGATWRVVSPLPVPPTVGDGDCALYLTAHSFLLRYTILAPLVNGLRGPDADYLFRSGDDGTTWQRADLVFGARRRLAPVALPDGDSILLAASDSSAALPAVALWRSHDDARTWDLLGRLPRLASSVFLPPPTAAYPPDAVHPLYAPVDPDVPHYLYRLGMLQSGDGVRWRALPPLPAPGATPDRIGLTNLLGVAPDGRLLAFGADPAAGVPPADQAGPRREPSQTLWAWNPLARRWERLPDPLPLPWPAHCSDQCWSAALTFAPDGALFLTVASAGPAGPALLYRLALPPSPIPTLAQLLAAQL